MEVLKITKWLCAPFICFDLMQTYLNIYYEKSNRIGTLKKYDKGKVFLLSCQEHLYSF